MTFLAIVPLPVDNSTGRSICNPAGRVGYLGEMPECDVTMDMLSCRHRLLDLEKRPSLIFVFLPAASMCTKPVLVSAIAQPSCESSHTRLYYQEFPELKLERARFIPLPRRYGRV